jgi:glucose/arabinose dehydrogenase
MSSNGCARALTALALATLAPTVASAPAGAAVERPRLDRIGTFAQPVYVASPPRNAATLAVVQRYGLVRLVRRGRVVRRPLLDLRRRVLIEDPRVDVDQRGLLSIAFAPDYRRSGRLYVYYVDRRERLRVDEWRRRTRTLRRVLDLGVATTQHHGGQLQFGPDGLLYLSTGMGSDPEVSQDPAAVGGKLLRIDPRRPGARPEVLALGLRNPWRFSFDRATGAIWIGDVGERHAEEVNLVPAGAQTGLNFGWPLLEGSRRRAAGDPAGLAGPALELGHAQGWCAIVGGYVVRAPTPRALRGRYLWGDVCHGRLWSARVRGGALTRAAPVGRRVPFLVSFGADALGRVYAVSLNGGVFRLRD